MEQIRLNGFGYDAIICPEMGANLISLTKPALHARSLRTPENNEDMSAAPFFRGTPFLFPPNRISDARFCFEGREYLFPMNDEQSHAFIHGTLHCQPFLPVSRTETSAVLRYEATADNPYLSFPHAFSVDMIFSLSEDGIRQTALVENRSDSNMPVGVGYHTTFALPLTEVGNPEDVLLSLDADAEIVRDGRYLPSGEIRRTSDLLTSLKEGTLRPAELPLSVHLKMGSGRQMILSDECQGVNVIYSASEEFGYWTLFNGGNTDFVCVEPQSWMTDSPNAPFAREQTGFSFLRPGEKRAYTTVISIEKA